MTIAVVILNFNGKEHLAQFLPSVLTHSDPHTVVVVDNGSTDDTLDWMRENYPTIQVIAIPENLGYTGGYNYAVEYVEQDILVFLNTDVEVTAGWIDPIQSMFENNPSIAACQPKLLSFNQKDHFEYAGAAGGYIDQFGFPFCKGRIFDKMEMDDGQYNESAEVFWATGACMFVRRKIFMELGGFDKDFFAHMEEIDLCWRIQNAGYKVFYCADSTVYHVGGGTLSKANPYKTYLNFRNGLTMFIKNERQGVLWWKIPVRAAFDMLALIKFTLFDSLKDGWAIIKAHGYFWAHISQAIDKRKKAKKGWKKNPDKQNIYQGSIVIAYYLKGVKEFRKLNF